MTLSMQQDAGFERHRKATRRDVFLTEMDRWCAVGGAVCSHRAALPKRAGSRVTAPVTTLRGRCGMERPASGRKSTRFLLCPGCMMGGSDWTVIDQTILDARGRT
jgi:hypothetical protein